MHGGTQGQPSSRPARLLVGGALLLGGTLCARSGLAREPDLDRAPPTVEHGSSGVVPSTSTQGAETMTFKGTVRYGWGSGQRPTPSGDAWLLEHRLGVDYGATASLSDGLMLTLRLPTIVWQSGAEDAVAANRHTPTSAAIGDLELGAKYELVSAGTLGGFGLAARANLWTPTATAGSYLGRGGAAQGDLVAKLSLIAVELRALGGLRWQRQGEDYYGHWSRGAVPWATALVVVPRAFGLDPQGRWLWSLEANGEVPVAPDFGLATATPVQLGASANLLLGGMSWSFGVRTPLHRALGAASLEGWLGLSWTPNSPDADADGVPDARDLCPELAEDRDGFQDDDGCPDFDNDEDGTPDVDDRCPKELEDEDGFEDGDGCPDLDNDEDGLFDSADACPDDPGPPPNGCPAGVAPAPKKAKPESPFGLDTEDLPPESPPASAPPKGPSPAPEAPPTQAPAPKVDAPASAP
mgnify:FL=1